MNASEREGTKTELFSRSALQGRMQCTASFSRKRLHPLPQTFATALAKHCNRRRKRLR